MTNTDSSDQQQRESLHSEYRRDLLARQISNAVNYDNAILTLSSAGLGLSLVFIKDILPIEKVDYLSLLISSWFLFGAAIISVIVSYFTSQKAIDKQLDIAYDYYIKEEEGAFKKKNNFSICTERLNKLSGFLCIMAIAITILFVTLNTRGIRMEKKGGTKSIKAQPIPNMQKVPLRDNSTSSNQSKESKPDNSSKSK